MRIPEEKIEDVKISVSIVDYISGFVQLRKRGKNFIGLCPFHQEKTPSFTVSDEKQIFHCFGCHAGGNVFKFLMEFKNISFVESVQEVAEYAGITIKYDEASKEKDSKNEIFYDINHLAAKYFSSNLLNSKDGEIAREYLKQRRIKPQIQRLFGIGYSLPGWEQFLLYAKENNVDLELARMLGLIDTKDQKKFYDKFRGRLIFPIFSTNGRVIGFGGRVIEKKDKSAKYLNSPESPIYLKRKSLYGLFQAKDEIRKLNKALLVEGYMDLIALFQNGVKNVVASSGTSLTEEQAQLLSRFTKNVTVVFDADSAGLNAAERSIEIFIKNDFEVKLANLPTGEDPDSYINKHGKEKFDELILNSKNFLDFKIQKYEDQGMLDDVASQTKVIREIIKSISLISDELKRSILLKSLSKKFNLREKLIETELQKFVKAEERSKNFKKTAFDSKKELHKVYSDTLKKTNAITERNILRLLFSADKEILAYIFDHINFDEIENPVIRDVFKTVHESYNIDIFSTVSLMDKIEDEEVKMALRKLLLKDDAISSKWEDRTHDRAIEKDSMKYATETVKKFIVYKIDKKIDEVRNKISSSSDENELLKLLHENQELTDEKKIMLEEL